MYLTVALCVLAGAADVEAKQPSPAQQTDLLKVAAHAYLHNRAGFQRFTCRFQMTVGKARSLEDARAARLHRSCTADGLWVVDGDRVRFELLADPSKVPLVQEGDNTFSKMFASQQFLGDSSIQLTVRRDFRIANINPPELPEGVDMTPFDMSWMGKNEQWSPGRHILRTLEEKKWPCHYDGTQVRDGQEVVVIRVASPGGRWHTYYLDPKRGFWPVEAEVTDNGSLSYRYLIPEVKSCPGELWYPARSLWIAYPFQGDSEFSVRVWDVQEMRLNELPAENPFCMDVPKGTTICDASVTLPAQYTLDRDEIVCVSGLKGVLAKARLKGIERSQVSLPGGTRRGGYMGLLVGVNAVFVVAIVASYLAQRRRRLVQGASGE